MSETDAMVFVIDDDRPMRESLKNLIRSVGLQVELFASAQEFLRSKRPDLPSCLVLDVWLPGLSGLDLQKRTGDAGIEIPIVFITGHGDAARSRNPPEVRLAREYSGVTQRHRTLCHLSSRRSYCIRCPREWRIDWSGCFKAAKQRKKEVGISDRGRNPPSRMREYVCRSAENRLENQRSRWSGPAIGSEANYINFAYKKVGSRPSGVRTAWRADRTFKA
jgi:CheY-like chemotaxis protein